MDTTTINAQTIYCAVLAAAAIAPTYPDQFIDDATPCGLPYGFDVQTEWDSTAHRTYSDPIDRARDNAVQSIIETARAELRNLINTPCRVVIRTAERGRVKLQNVKKNLLSYAAAVKANQRAFGGGIKPAPRASGPKAWPAASVKVVYELCQDKLWADATALAIDKAGALFYQFGSRPCMLFAPMPVDGLPDVMQSARRTDGKYCVFHLPSGQTAGQAHGSRAHAEASAREAIEQAGSEKFAAALARAGICNQDAARALWFADCNIEDQQAITARIESAACHDVAEVVAQATAAAAIEQPSSAQETRQAAAPARELVHAGAHCSAGTTAPHWPAAAAIERTDTTPAPRQVGAYDVAMAAMALERISNLWQHDGARRQAIESGRLGNPGALPYIMATLLRIAANGQADDRRAAREALRTLHHGGDGSSAGAHTPVDPGQVDAIPRPPAPVEVPGCSEPVETSHGLHDAGRDLAGPGDLPSADDFDAIDPDTLSADQVQRWPHATVRALVAHLEDINYHGECLTVRALWIDREDLAAQSRAINRQHLQAGQLSMDLHRERYELGQRIKAAELGQPDPQPGAPLTDSPACTTAPPGPAPGAAGASRAGPGCTVPSTHEDRAYGLWRADLAKRFEGFFFMPMTDPPPGARRPACMTGAELQTLRECCGLSREDLGLLAHVQARTIKHWESGRAGIPADVADLVLQIDDTVHCTAQDAINAIRATMQDRQGPPGDVVLLRYQSADDLARHRPDMAGLPPSVHGAVIGRMRQALRALPGFATVAPRVVWMDSQHFDAWRQARNHPGQLPDDETSRAQWAREQVDAQALPHRADQPPG